MAGPPTEGAAAGWYRLELPAKENQDQARPGPRGAPGGTAARASASPCCGTRRPARRRTGARCSTAARATAPPARRSPARSGRNPAWWISSACSRVGHAGARAGSPRLRGPAERAAAGYSLVSWTGLVPEEFIEQAAAVFTTRSATPPATRRSPPRMGRPAGPRAHQRPAPALRDCDVYTVAARHDDDRRAGGADRDGGGPGRPGLGSPDVHGGDAGSTAGTGSACC